MDNKDNKRGFSGLIDLTSDAGTLPQTQPRQTSPRPAAVQKPVFALLELTKWPSLPAPWSSVDSGETWVWEDFFLTFQKKPVTVLDLTMKMQGKKSEHSGITYHYAMSVFYRINKNPHGPSHRPIMTVALEQADMGMLEKMFGSEAGDILQAEDIGEMEPMIGLFTGEAHLNLGEYEGDVSPQAVKTRFFEILGHRLGVSGQPKMIGDLAQAHGHPETGLPTKKKKHDSDANDAHHLRQKKSDRKLSSEKGGYVKVRDTQKVVALLICIAVAMFFMYIYYEYQRTDLSQEKSNKVLSSKTTYTDKKAEKSSFDAKLIQNNTDEYYFTKEYFNKNKLGKAEIKILQKNLSKIGYKVGVVDGIIGNKTLSALKKFCEDYKILPRENFANDIIDISKAHAIITNSHPDWIDNKQRAEFSKWFEGQSSKYRDANIGNPNHVILLFNYYKFYKENPPSQPLPINGILEKVYSEGVAPLKIITKHIKQHYYIKLVNVKNKEELLSCFIRGGTSLEILVPVGDYEIRSAVGETWYGEKYLFGPSTSYSKADDIFSFRQEDTGYVGYTVEMFLQAHGNLRTDKISAFNF